MDVFNAPKIGSPRAIQSRYGNTSGTSTDIVYPVSRLTHGAFSSGKTIEFNFRSDKHRHALLRSSRLVVHMEHMFGEVDSTCDKVTGPKDQAKGSRPSKSIMYATMPNTTLFGTGQARYVLNSVVVTNQNHLLDSSLVQLLLTQNNDGPSTSGSNMMTSTRKDTGLSDSSYFKGAQAGAKAENYTLLPLSPAPYLNHDGVNTVTDSGTSAGELLSAAVDRSFQVEVLSGGTTDATSFVCTVAAAAALEVGMAITVATGGTSTAVITAGTTIASLTNVVESGAVTGVTVALNESKKFTTGVTTLADVAEDANKTATVLKIEDLAARDLTTVSLERLSKAFAVKVKANGCKMVTPNPRAEILQQGFNEESGMVVTQVSEPILLDTWSTPYAIMGDHALFLTISPDWQKNLFFDNSGQYGCPDGDGGLINCAGNGSDSFPGVIKARQIYSRVTSVALHVHYVHPSEPYIPPSVSLRVSPVQVTTRQMQSRSVNESIVVPPSIKSCMVFMRQNAQHVCIDRSELSLAAAGINVLGATVPVSTTDPVTAAGGTYLYDSTLQEAARDPDIDPRRASTNASTDLIKGLERTAPCFFDSLQVQCGGAIQPREALSGMSPPNGEMSRAWQLYTEFVGRSQGYRGAVLSYSEFCGSYSSNHASGARCGDRGCFFLFDLQQKPGSLASTLEIRGQLNQEPHTDAKQELVVVCVSDSIMNIGYQSPSETAVLTEIQPIIGG